MKKHGFQCWAQFQAMLTLMAAAGCASQVTISSNIRRNLPVIIDESRAGRRLEAGFAYRSGQDEGERIDYYYQEAVSQTFTAYERSNTMGYIRLNPWPSATIRLGADAIGYSGDLAFRREGKGLSGYLSPGATMADKSVVGGYGVGRPIWFRATAGASVNPFT